MLGFALLAALLSSPDDAASVHVTLRTTGDAPADTHECFDDARFAAALTARTHVRVMRDAKRVVDVEYVSSPGGVRVDVNVRSTTPDADVSPPRSVSAASCASANDAAVLIAALALGESTPPETPIRALAPAAIEESKSPANEPPSASPDASVSVVDRARPTRAFAAASLTAGLVPGASAGFDVGAQHRLASWGRVAAEVEARGMFVARSSAGDYALGAMGALGSACVRADASDRFDAALCAGGAVWSNSMRGTASAASSERVSFAFAAQPEVRMRVVGPVRITLGGGAAVPFTRLTVQSPCAGAEFRQAAVAFRGLLGLSVDVVP